MALLSQFGNPGAFVTVMGDDRHGNPEEKIYCMRIANGNTSKGSNGTRLQLYRCYKRLCPGTAHAVIGAPLVDGNVVLTEKGCA